MDNLTTVVVVILGIPFVIGTIWHWILMWRYSKAVFVASIFVPLIPTIYFYFKYWKNKDVRIVFYLQIPAMLSILILLIFAALQS